MDLAKILDELRAEHRQLTACIEGLEILARGSASRLREAPGHKPGRVSASKKTGVRQSPVKRLGKTVSDEPAFAE